MASPFHVPVAQLLRDVPSTYVVSFEAPFDEAHEFAPRGPAETDVFAEATLKVRLTLQSFSGGLRAKGKVEAPWHGVCRRCSVPVLGVSLVAVDERFVDERARGDDEAYLIENDFVDLAPLDANLIGNGPEILRRIDAVGTDFAMTPGTCGKDGQSVPVGCGQATMRLSGMTIGGTAS